MKNVTENTKALQKAKSEAVAKALRENLRKRKKQKVNRKDDAEVSTISIKKENEQ